MSVSNCGCDEDEVCPDCSWEKIGKVFDKLQIVEKELESKDAQIKILRDALELSCVDDCAITLSVCHRNTLEEIIRAADKRARQALAEIDKMKGV